MGLISSRDFVDLLHVKPYPGDVLTTNCKLHGTPAWFCIFGSVLETPKQPAVNSAAFSQERVPRSVCALDSPLLFIPKTKLGGFIKY